MHNDGGKHRVVVTKDLPGERWLKVLTGADCRVEVCQSAKPILSVDDIKQLIGSSCSGVLGQLTEVRCIRFGPHGAYDYLYPWGLHNFCFQDKATEMRVAIPALPNSCADYAQADAMICA